MIKFMSVIYRKPGTTPEHFRNHYETKHVPFVKRLMGKDLNRYIRNYTNPQDPAFAGAQKIPFDCITELHFLNQASFERAVAVTQLAENAAFLRADEATFIDSSRCQHAIFDAVEE